MSINQITIVGTGLIGGSFGLALKKRGFTGRIIGCGSRPQSLAKAEGMGAIDIGIEEPRQAVQGSDVVLLATPVGRILDFIEQLGPVLPPHVLLTDVGSTKKEIVARAQAVFGAAAATRFLAGHPMAGKEHSGIDHADADLFENAVWLFTPVADQNVAPDSSPAGPISDFLALVRTTGARALVMDADRHDHLCAWVSHLPQMIATALASSLEDEFGDDEALKAVGGRALREMTRIAASPYSMWRDIAFTNTGNIAESLSKLEQRLAHIRENLRTRGLQEEFENGNKFRKS
jgi:prephenate dehydrogenase